MTVQKTSGQEFFVGTDTQHAESLKINVDMFGDAAYAKLKIANHKSTAFRNIFVCAVAPGLE